MATLSAFSQNFVVRFYQCISHSASISNILSMGLNTFDCECKKEGLKMRRKWRSLYIFVTQNRLCQSK